MVSAQLRPNRSLSLELSKPADSSVGEKMLFLAPGYIFPHVATPVTVAIDFAQAVKEGAYSFLDLKASPILNPAVQPPSRVSTGTGGKEERNEEVSLRAYHDVQCHC
jgi:hypothetical protein